MGAPRTSAADSVRRALTSRPGSASAAVLVPTSGSTGTPRTVRISGAALRASGEATAARLGGHGRWLLALPTTHVAGLQVLARSVLAGTEPVLLDTGPGFRAGTFAHATEALLGAGPGGTRLYTSLVPTQLHRLLAASGALGAPDDASPSEDPAGEPAEGRARGRAESRAEGRAGLDALRRYDAVLVGGAATPPALLSAARRAGVAVVTTYGMSETAGGCVYDGVPLDGVGLRIRDGRVEISGPVLADGYADDPAATAAAFLVDGATGRWFRTSDVGRVDEGPAGQVLTVLGRADDMLITGGVNVAPAAVEALLAGWGGTGEAGAGGAGIGEVCVVGLPDDEWGTRVVAVVTLAPPAPGAVSPEGPGARVLPEDIGARLLPGVRAHVAAALGTAAAPRDVVVVDALPLRGPGKPDRHAAQLLAAQLLAAQRLAPRRRASRRPDQRPGPTR